MMNGNGYSASEVHCPFGSGRIPTPEARPSVPINDSTVPHLTRCCDNCYHVFISKRSNFITHNGLDTISYFGFVCFVKVNFVLPQGGESAVA